MNKKLTVGLMILVMVYSSAALAEFRLESSDIGAGTMLQAAQVYSGFGCSGGNTSPQLAWSGAPKGTKSFAVTVYDPDAPTGSGWWHWLVYNIPAGVQELPRDAGDIEQRKAPAGATQGRTDFGSYGYGGARPPQGRQPHRYQFKVFALDVENLDLPKDASTALIGFNLNAHTLDSTGIEAVYQR